MWKYVSSDLNPSQKPLDELAIVKQALLPSISCLPGSKIAWIQYIRLYPFHVLFYAWVWESAIFSIIILLLIFFVLCINWSSSMSLLFKIVKSRTYLHFFCLSSSLSPAHAWDITPLNVSNVLVLLEKIHRAMIWFISSLFKTNQICLSAFSETLVCRRGSSLGYTTVVPVVRYCLSRRCYLWRGIKLIASWRCWTSREAPDSHSEGPPETKDHEIRSYL